MALRSNGGFVALTQDGLETLELESGRLAPVSNPEAHIPENRFNDAKCDRAGRLWAGSMPLDAATPTGALYRFDPDGTWMQMDGGFSVSNGLDWSPDDRTFYFVDTGPGIIYAYDFDLSAGEISGRREFVRIDGRPDGLTVDAEGHVWCAIWDGWCVRRYAPDGRLDREVSLPVPRPTSCTFGGENLETLFITSAPRSFAQADARRCPAVRWRICIQARCMWPARHKFWRMMLQLTPLSGAVGRRSPRLGSK